MSIISSKAEHVYKGNALMQEAHIAGASRPPTDEEIEAGAKALYDALNSVCFSRGSPPIGRRGPTISMP